ncbi:MAG: hypothetical protein AAF692_04030 [Pseudomonadota bacterium]
MWDAIFELLSVDPGGAPKRYRAGCWWAFGLFWIVVLGLVALAAFI